jgi:dihydropteroate synthase
MSRAVTDWQLRDQTLELGRRTLIMGVVNITPDSFSDGGAFLDPQAAIAHALALLDEGADLIDLGAESTRPGSHAGPGNTAGSALHKDGAVSKHGALSTHQEQARLLPVLEGVLTHCPRAIVSVDTYKAATAAAALQAGAQILNDVSGFHWDPAMPEVCARHRCGVILMHTRGLPDEWKTQSALQPGELVRAVQAGLHVSLQRAGAAGIPEASIVLDPGYGFGKRGGENFALLGRQAELLALGRPLLAGVSRKSFLGGALAPLHNGQVAPPTARETASVAAMVASILHGASIVRVHRVRPALEAALIADEIVKQLGTDI